MQTLSSMSLKVARIITEVLESTATAGAQTSVTDTANLIQSDAYFDRGTLWFLSGSHAGIVAAIKGHTDSRLTFTDVGAPAISAGTRYAAARAIFPYSVIVASIQDALAETFVVIEAQPVTPLMGDGETTVFTLPDGVARVVSVILENQDDTSIYYTSTHWEEQYGNLYFDSAPQEQWKIRVFYREDHPTLTNATDEIDSQINDEWLRWKAAEYALYWGVKTYGEAKQYRIEELLNRALTKQKGLYPRKPIVKIRTMS